MRLGAEELERLLPPEELNMILGEDVCEQQFPRSHNGVDELRLSMDLLSNQKMEE